MSPVHGELESHTLSKAFIISLLVHFAGIGGLELGRNQGWWEAGLPLFSRSSAIEEVIREAAERAEQRQAEQKEVPETELVFMDVDPSQAVQEAPQETKYYSTVNTRAANPDPREDTETPKIDGRQEQIPKLTDTLRPDPQAPAPPAPPVEEKTPPAAPPVEAKPAPEPEPEEEKPEPKPPGETLLARAAPRPPKPVETPPPQPVTPRPRPRTLAEVKQRAGILEGQKLRQRGGVRLGGVEGMDVKATPFGAYDAAFIAAVQARWFSLLDERGFVGNEAGKVVIEFNLTSDGRITSLRVAEAGVSETLAWMCQRAILDPAPYRPFPPDLRRLLGRDSRPVRFTFYYNQ